MKECKCDDVEMRDVHTEHKALIHEACGGVFDPAARAVREHRNNPTAPRMPNVEYRGFDK